jgi:hypothetical protein
MPGVLTELRERLQLPPGPHLQVGGSGTRQATAGTVALGSSADTATGSWWGMHTMEATPPQAARPDLPWPLPVGRLTWDQPYQVLGPMRVLVPPDQSIEDWRLLTLDARDLANIPSQRLLQILADLSPDVSRALWDFLRLCNPGWEAHVYRPGTKVETPAGRAAVKDFLKLLETRHGSVDVVINKLFWAAFIRGAMLSELVLDEEQAPIDIATPDPVTIRFERTLDPLLGQVWVPGQFQGGRYVELTRSDTISYLPVDPVPGAAPYGRSPAAPALFTSVFVLGMLHDVRRVVAQQGHMRMDLSIQLEELRKALPPNIVADPGAFRDWVNNTIQWLESTYKALEPDDAFVHTSDIVANRPIGTMNSDAVQAIDGLIKPMERLLARSLKTTGVLMLLDSAASDATATRQWEVEVAGIKSVQHLGEAVLSRLLTTACTASGVEGEVEFQFAELRVSELFRDEQTRGLVIDNAEKMYMSGWISQDEAAELATGHDADQPEPRAIPPRYQPTGVGMEDLAIQTGPQVGQPQNGPEAGGAPDAKEAGDSQQAGETADTKGRWFKLRWPGGFNGHAGQHNGHDRSQIKGSGQPLAFVPSEVRYDAGDQRMVSEEWDRTMQAYEGLLDATVLPAGERARA